MTAFCAIVNCSNRHGRDNKSFFRLPKVIEHQGDKTRELSKERRDKWSANISRADIKPSSLDNIRVCSDHLIEGKPCQLYNNLNPDWVPTVNMGHDKVFQLPPPSALNSRYARNINMSSKKKQSEAASALLQLQDTDNTSTVSVEQDVETGTLSTN